MELDQFKPSFQLLYELKSSFLNRYFAHKFFFDKIIWNFLNFFPHSNFSKISCQKTVSFNEQKNLNEIKHQIH